MSKPFSFANLIGSGKTRAEAEDDEDQTDAKAADTEEDQSEDQTDDQAQDGEEDDAQGDTARRAVLAERARIAGILAAATPETVAQAAHFATQTDLTVEQARAALAVAPKAAGGLSARMQGRNAAPVGAAAGDTSGSTLPPELQAAQARRSKKDR